jgi:hypothetical protein
VLGRAGVRVRRWWRYGQLLQPFVVEIQSAGGMVPRQPGLQRTTAQSALSWHLTSHAHAWPQVTSPPHARLPLQLTLHAPAPQVTVLQVWRPLQVIVHDAAPPQLTPLLHWLLAEHRTLQFQPAGQLTARLQTSLLSEQSTVQIFWAVLHDVHCDGHTAASTAPESAAITQNPSTQLRPSAQRCSALQAKSVLRWLTEQPAASARATAIQSAGFTASLRR